MKKLMMLVVIVLGVTLGFNVASAKKDNDKEQGSDSEIKQQENREKMLEQFEQKRRGRPDTPGIPGVPRGREGRKRMNRETMEKQQLETIDKQIAGKRKIHEEFVGELEAIKKVALEEKAERTAEKLQQLIDKKGKKFAETIEKYEERRQKLQDQFKKRAEGQAKRKERMQQLQKEGKPVKEKAVKEKADKKEEAKE